MAVTEGRTQVREPELGSIGVFYSDAPDFVSLPCFALVSQPSPQGHTQHTLLGSTMNFGDSALASENKELKRQLFQKGPSSSLLPHTRTNPPDAPKS